MRRRRAPDHTGLAYLRQLKRRGIPQTQIADELCVTQGTVSGWLNGRWAPKTAHRTLLWEKYGIPVASWRSRGSRHGSRGGRYVAAPNPKTVKRAGRVPHAEVSAASSSAGPEPPPSSSGRAKVRLPNAHAVVAEAMADVKGRLGSLRAGPEDGAWAVVEVLRRHGVVFVEGECA